MTLHIVMILLAIVAINQLAISVRTRKNLIRNNKRVCANEYYINHLIKELNDYSEQADKRQSKVLNQLKAEIKVFKKINKRKKNEVNKFYKKHSRTF